MLEDACDEVNGFGGATHGSYQNRDDIIEKGRCMLSHLIGPLPDKDNPKFADWDERNSLIMEWQWNSMMPKM
ncbi:hypothetical protein F511_30431 [Dorcoceras hygrometricum]|uniref:Uncharacterized protein n=1 Tax=Dorcoceras hygrometricum TaxID=472368 RepID=A0A2Z7ANH0_9LAMI|nr:hypothetical protein F511_30431 [Dorcoceras hygrometricum]